MGVQEKYNLTLWTIIHSPQVHFPVFQGYPFQACQAWKMFYVTFLILTDKYSRIFKGLQHFSFSLESCEFIMAYTKPHLVHIYFWLFHLYIYIYIYCWMCVFLYLFSLWILSECFAATCSKDSTWKSVHPITYLRVGSLRKLNPVRT